MKTAEEIFEEVYTQGCDGWISFEQAIKAMKTYANQKLDEAAEKANLTFDGSTCLDNVIVDKESILSLKDKL